MAKNRRPSSPHDRTDHKRQHDRPQTKLRDGAAQSQDDERIKQVRDRITTHLGHFKASFTAIKASLARSGLETADDAVALLLDLTDEKAQAIARSCAARDLIHCSVQGPLGSGARPFGIWSMRNERAVSLLRPSFPFIAAETAGYLHERGVVVVVVAEGVATAILVPPALWESG